MRTVSHFSIHRIHGTELRIVADVEAGVFPIIQVEEDVVRGYIQRQAWPHRWINLFILQDLQPLARQLRNSRDLPALEVSSLGQRPVVNVYDLADPAECHVFVNRQIMVKEGYWEDLLAVQGLLAHEHAHPLAENDTIRASRQLHIGVTWEITGKQAHSETEETMQDGAASFFSRHLPSVGHQIELLVDALCLHGPREVFTNKTTIHSGFGEALLHLDRRNMANATASVQGRQLLGQQLQQEIARGKLSQQEAGLILLVGDMRGYLDLVLEIAPFYRAGQPANARALESVLESSVFPLLEPEIHRVFSDLSALFINLRANLTSAELVTWVEAVLEILAKVLGTQGLLLNYRLRVDL